MGMQSHFFFWILKSPSLYLLLFLCTNHPSYLMCSKSMHLLVYHINLDTPILLFILHITSVYCALHIPELYEHLIVCENKMPTRCNRWFLLQILLLAQHVSGTIMPIIRSTRVLYRWLLPVVFGALVFKLSVWCGAEGYASGLRAAAKHQSTKYHRQQPSV